MKKTIEVKNGKEAERVRMAMTDPAIRAFINVMGILLTLPTDRSRERVLRFVDDKFAEEDPQYVSVFSR